jgi:hypothetical protein
MSKCIGCGCELTTGDVNNLCNKCEGRPIINIPLIDSPLFEPTYYAPWTCPRCGTVHAPWVSRCDCPPPSITTNGINT